jgi:mRNA interferase MazF
MGAFVKGDVVIVPFPFSDLTSAKRRPAVVIADLSGEDLIVCQVTSQSKSDGYSVIIEATDFESGGLNQASSARPNRLFTADSNIILYKTGVLTKNKMNEITAKLIEIIS